ncbi:MAG: HAD-IB family phosphatase, partial [Pseudomonadota bacterium]
MRGELDFKTALEERVEKLKNLPVAALQKTLAQMQLTKGAQDMVQVMRYYGATCVLVSGGFTFFTGEISKQCGFQFHHGNTLEITADKLTGNILPPLLDKQAKLTYLAEYTSRLGLNAEDTLAVGDGANDIPMLLGAGLGIGY